MHEIRKWAFAAAIAIVTSGCTVIAPNYDVSVSNVQQLKSAGDYTATVGPFSAGPKSNDDSISLRGSSLKSPVNDSYAAYLANALKQELSAAHKLAPDAELELSGVLTKNDIDISGFTTGTGDIEAHFIVKRKGEVRFDAVKSYHNQFESAFPGAVAIPKGQAAYPSLVQGLLAQLYSDPAFMAALK